MVFTQSRTSLVLTERTSPVQLELKTSTLPPPTAGTATVEILSTSILTYAKVVLSGEQPFPLSLPMTPGGGGIVRLASLPPDATSLSEGQLCFLEPTVKGRDNPDNQILLGIHGGTNPAARKLMDGPWRNGTWATYTQVPLENLHALDEEVLVKKLGYSFHDLAYLTALAVPCGGLIDALDAKPGERLLIAPATGSFGGAAVEVARGLGVDVVMAGRNAKQLERMRDNFMSKSPHAGKIDIVVLSGDPEVDAANIRKCGVIDKYLDFSPRAAANSTHITASLLSLKREGAACFQGGIQTGVGIPYGLVMFNDLSLKGKFMYTRDAVKRLIHLVESGKIKLGEHAGGITTKGVFGLKEWQDAIDAAEKEAGWGVQVCFEPRKGL